jgi:signal peptidase I
LFDPALVRQWATHLTDWLANLTTAKVLVAVGSLMVVLALLRLTARGRSRGSDGLMENVQVVLSVVVVVFLLIRPFLFQAFYIPSGSMEPTLMGPTGNTGGDRLLVNKLVYRVMPPNRFDIAVFKAPQHASPDEKEFIKRIIGLPGETIAVAAPELRVDGRPAFRLSAEGGAGLATYTEQPPRITGSRAELNIGYGDALKVIARPQPRVTADPFQVTVDGKVELESPLGRIEERQGLGDYGGRGHPDARVFTIDGEPRLAVVPGQDLSYETARVLIDGRPLREPYLKEAPRYVMLPRKLGPAEYFMLGDNRNNSNDSHSWGPLERDRIIGRAEILFWPLHRARLFHWWLLSALAGLLIGYQLLYRLAASR